MNMNAIATAPSPTIPPTRRARRAPGESLIRALSARAVASKVNKANVSHAQTANPSGKSAVITTTATTISRTRASTGPGRLGGTPFLDPRARPLRRLAQHFVLAFEVGIELCEVLEAAGVTQGDDGVPLQPARVVPRH